MRLAVEIYTSRPLAVRAGRRIGTRLLSGAETVAGSEGEDIYPGGVVIPGGKRLAGLGRRFTWPEVGKSPGEAAPGAQFDLEMAEGEVVLLIETDIILDQGILSDALALKFVYEGGSCGEIPLRRSDVRITWPKRGTFVIRLGDLLRSAAFNQ